MEAIQYLRRGLFDFVSLVNNDFAIESSTETWDESLRKCQFYYEKSYDNGTLPGAVTTLQGSLDKLMTTTLSTAAGACYPAPFQWEYSTIKRGAPTTTIYNPILGTAGSVRVETYRNGVANNTADVTVATYWTLAGNGTKGIDYNVSGAGAIVTATAAADNLSCIIRLQYAADARLGV